jgi:hypothetical protein
MNDAVTILNRMLRVEYGSLLCRLTDANPYITWNSAQDALLVGQMCADESQALGELVTAILDLRGAPVPRNYPISTGGVHFLSLDFLMPQVIASKKALVAAYESAPPTGIPFADALKARILDQHRRHLAALQRLHSDLATAGTVRYN